MDPYREKNFVKSICQHLRREGFVAWSSFDRVSLMPGGSREAERIRDVRLKKKEDRILDELYNYH
jgi:hypothetical protein